MKKIYNKPSMLVIDVNIEAVMTCCSTNIRDNGTSAILFGEEIKESTSGGEADAAGYRSNLWGD